MRRWGWGLLLGLFLLPSSVVGVGAAVAPTTTPIRAVTLPPTAQASLPAVTQTVTSNPVTATPLPTTVVTPIVTGAPSPPPTQVTPTLTVTLPLTGALPLTPTNSPTPRPSPSPTKEVTPALSPWTSPTPANLWPSVTIDSPLVRTVLLALGGGVGLLIVLLVLGRLFWHRRLQERLAQSEEGADADTLPSLLHQDAELGGRYVLNRKVGEGSLGTVWEAEDTFLHRVVALKALHPRVQIEAAAGGRSPVEDLYWEATATARLQHPNIVRIYDMQRWGDDVPLYVVMEFVKGTTLQTMLEQSFGKPLHDAVVWEIAQGVLRALEYAHQHGTIHRDLKPGNIMLTGGGEDFRVVVVDWGLCYRLSGEALHAIPRTLREDKLVGSFNYMSPEQWQGQPIDHRADLYAFGVVLFEMLTGRLPFYGRTTKDLAYLHLMQPPPEVTSFRPHLRTEVVQIVDELLAKVPAKRPASATAVLERLKPLQGRLSEEDGEEEEAPAPTATS